MDSVCIYTVLIGGNEHLNEQAVARNSNVPFICLTDVADFKSDTWQIRTVNRCFSNDQHRSQRKYKILAHTCLPDFRYSLYIDNSILLKQTPEALFQVFPLVPDCHYVAGHSYRQTVLDEFLENQRLNLDDSSRIYEQLQHYTLSHREVLQEQPYWNAFHIRDHSSQKVREAMELWFYRVMRYSRRDQLSFNAICHILGYQPTRISLDNYESPYHSWPHVVPRKEVAKAWSPLCLAPATALYRQLERENEEKDLAIKKLTQDLEEMSVQLKHLNRVIASALHWQTRSAARRAFYKWKPPLP